MSISSVGSAPPSAPTQAASNARAADGDYKAKGVGHEIKDSDGDYKPTNMAAQTSPARSAMSASSSAVQASLTLLTKGG